ncbi:MAG: PDDEXK nuclease domain-containing protein [Chloroflexota bacterium]|nr:PDDEXK nuclease domain-containing protein [Chloroflexota bacterium]
MSQQIGVLSVFDSSRLKEPPAIWLVLLKWLLLIPRYIVLLLLMIAFLFTNILSYIAIFLTAKFPPNRFDCKTRFINWTYRTGFYSLEEYIYRKWFDINWGSNLEFFKDNKHGARRFPAGPWTIDFLARDVDTNSLVVIQLKRGETSDSTVGQLLRYISWIKEKVAAEGQNVRGIIITKDVDAALEYAVRNLEYVEIRTYEVDFQLKLKPFQAKIRTNPDEELVTITQ